MIERDVNHPSIIIWSNGNEGGWNYNLDPLFAKYDKLQKRHMVHPWADFNDLDTPPLSHLSDRSGTFYQRL